MWVNNYKGDELDPNLTEKGVIKGEGFMDRSL